jgi:GNAT superfamily N-acetyltransferase
MIAPMTRSVLIRDARLPEEKPQLCAFIDALQRFEHPLEPDRRLDARVGEEYFDALVPHALARHGRILVAEMPPDGLVGWAVVHEDMNEIFVAERERLHGYVSELFVAEAARGAGVGRALLDACDDWARTRKLAVMMIGVLPGNARAARVYGQAGFAPYALRLRKYLRA